MRMPASARGLTDGRGAAGHHSHRRHGWSDPACGSMPYMTTATEAIIAAADYTPYIRRVGEARPPHDPRVEPRRWPVERTHAWYNHFRRILIRREKKVA